MNKSSGRFMSVANTSDVIGTNVVTVPQTTADTARWTYDNDSSYLNDGKATLTNVSSPTDKMLDVEGVNVDIWSHTGSGCQHFTIFRSNNLDYEGLYCIRYGPYFVTQHTDNNVYLSTTATAASFWSFMKVDKGNASITTFSYTHSNGSYDTTCNNILFARTLDSLYNTNIRVNPLVVNSFNDIKTSDIYVYRGHGHVGKLVFQTTNDVQYGIIECGSSTQNNTDIYAALSTIPENGLSNLRCALFLGCETATPGVMGHNVVDATYDLGAHFVLGTTELVYTTDSDKFLRCFLEGVANNESVHDCVVKAMAEIDNELYTNTDGKYPIKKYGDTSQYIDFLTEEML